MQVVCYYLEPQIVRDIKNILDNISESKIVANIKKILKSEVTQRIVCIVGIIKFCSIQTIIPTKYLLSMATKAGITLVLTQGIYRYKKDEGIKNKKLFAIGNGYRLLTLMYFNSASLYLISATNDICLMSDLREKLGRLNNGKEL